MNRPEPATRHAFATRVDPELIKGPHGPLIVQVERLADLDAAIDGLFADLAREFPNDPARVHAELDERCPYFGCVWASARALAEDALARPHKRVLEIGSGLALPSLALASFGRLAAATDFHPEVPRFLARNREHNGLSERMLPYLAIDWRGAPDLADVTAFAPDAAIASDILYEKEQPARVAALLDRLFEEVPSLREATVADPGRPYLQAFSDEMRTRGFTPELSTRTARDGVGTREIFLLRFARPW